MLTSQLNPFCHREKPLFLRVLCGLVHERGGEMMSRLWKLRITE